jgi:hypothetical protein
VFPGGVAVFDRGDGLLMMKVFLGISYGGHFARYVG